MPNDICVLHYESIKKIYKGGSDFYTNVFSLPPFLKSFASCWLNNSLVPDMYPFLISEPGDYDQTLPPQ